MKKLLFVATIALFVYGTKANDSSCGKDGSKIKD